MDNFNTEYQNQFQQLTEDLPLMGVDQVYEAMRDGEYIPEEDN